MLGDSAVLSGGGGGSGDAAAAATAGGGGAERTATSGGAVGSNSGDDERGRIEEGERSFGGNRWPRQETLALLRIRSDMDVAFRDAAVKGPLWEEVSRKLAELGYHRNAKKCKEKFENVYKYHKRTKEGRSGKSDGKTYRFFDQLQALENHPSLQSPNSSNSRPLPPPPQPQPQAPPALVVTTAATTVPMPLPHVSTVPSTTTTPPNISMPQGIAISTTPSMNLTNTIPSFPTSNPTNFPPSTANPSNTTTPISFPTIPMDLLSNSTSSSTSSDETLEGRRKRKRKWKDFFERLMKEVVEKQEDLQKKFLEAVEKREHDRTAREEAWRVQEMQRINREREILAQERSIAAAKDAAVMSFLQKIAEQQNLGQALSNIVQPPRPPQPVTQPSAAPPPAPTPAQGQAQIVQQQQPVAPVTQPGPPPTQTVMAGQVGLVPQQGVTGMEIVKADNGENSMGASSSRWPKVEVEALIKLRTSLDSKYQENGPKGPLWEEISALMRNLGYNRNAKRCKEKWENINKYFKKVKESNKKRPEDSKTCPYFHQLDALYREKKSQVVVRPPESSAAPLMVQPEQQWPPQQKITRDVTMEDAENDPMDQHHEDDEDDVEDEDEEGESGGSGSGGGGGGNYEIVASKPAAAAAE